ncbi:hypothetical protein C8R46DRAFT_1230245 [Mycena filopes]|nr:hypothetical protein C8R46DRAFT_1230245 [Mycena filopes]
MLAAPCSLPILRRLDLFLCDPERASTPEGIVLFSDAPQLRTVILNDSAALSALLPWSQLTSVTLNQFYPHECAPVLSRTLNLQRCQLWLVSDGENDHPPMISLPHLTALTLTTYKRYLPVPGYLDTLLVPELRSLQVPQSFLEDDPIDTLTSFIAKSGCRLQELRITGIITAEEEDRYRAAFPLILTLSFRGWPPSGPPGGGRVDIYEVDELEDF